VFVSYSHADQPWLERLRVFLAPHMRGETLTLWDDTRTTPGEHWDTEIRKAIVRSRVAVLLVSPEFLASSFITDVELPLIRHETRSGLTILWVAVRPSAYQTTFLREIQAANDPSKPLSSLHGAERDRVLVEIAERIARAADVNSLANSLRLIDEFTPHVDAFIKGLPEPEGPVTHGVMAEQHAETVVFREDGMTHEVITAQDLEKLDGNARKLIRAYERTMQDLFDRWVMIKPKRSAPDAEIRDEANTEADTIRRELCAELTELLNFIESMGKSLRDHYNHVRFICRP
jgi:hypothetical protein